MIELIRTDDPVFLGWLESRLAAVGIDSVVLDGHTSSVYGGALGAVARRVMVANADIERARLILFEARVLDGDGNGDGDG